MAFDLKSIFTDCRVLLTLLLIFVIYVTWSDKFVVKNSGVVGPENIANVVPFKPDQDLTKGGVVSGNSNGALLAPVPSGVGTASLEERKEIQQTGGVGLSSSQLLPRETSKFDEILPVEFAKGENFLTAESRIGEVPQPLRFANYDLRRSPEIRVDNNATPFLMTSVHGPDVYRKSLDVVTH